MSNIDVDEFLEGMIHSEKDKKKKDNEKGQEEKVNRNRYKYGPNLDKKNNIKDKTRLWDMMNGEKIRDDMWISILDALIFVLRIVMGVKSITGVLIVLRIAMSIALSKIEPVYDGTMEEFIDDVTNMIETGTINMTLMRKVVTAIIFFILPYIKTLLSYIFKPSNEDDKIRRSEKKEEPTATHTMNNEPVGKEMRESENKEKTSKEEQEKNTQKVI